MLRRADMLKTRINSSFWNDTHRVFAEWIEVDQSSTCLFDPKAGRSHPSVLAPMRLGIADWNKGRQCLETLAPPLRGFEWLSRTRHHRLEQRDDGLWAPIAMPF